MNGTLTLDDLESQRNLQFSVYKISDLKCDLILKINRYITDIRTI